MVSRPARCAHEPHHRARTPADFSGIVVRDSLRVVLSVGGTEGRGSNAGPHRAAVHAAFLRLYQADGKIEPSAGRRSRGVDEGMAAARSLFSSGGRGASAGAAELRRIFGRLDLFAG